MILASVVRVVSVLSSSVITQYLHKAEFQSLDILGALEHDLNSTLAVGKTTQSSEIKVRYCVSRSRVSHALLIVELSRTLKVVSSPSC